MIGFKARCMQSNKNATLLISLINLCTSVGNHNCPIAQETLSITTGASLYLKVATDLSHSHFIQKML